MVSRRAFAAALAALPFARSTQAATIPDIHQLRPWRMSVGEAFGVIKQAILYFPAGTVASLLGKTYGVYGTPLACTVEHTDTEGGVYIAVFEEINL